MVEIHIHRKWKLLHLRDVEICGVKLLIYIPAFVASDGATPDIR